MVLWLHTLDGGDINQLITGELRRHVGMTLLNKRFETRD